MIQIWVDVDACPAVIKDMLYRTAERTKTVLILVANTLLQVPPSPYINLIKVKEVFNVADNKIVQQMGSGDLVITADIPLASEVIVKGGYALDPRGEFYTNENIKDHLAIHNFQDALRNIGVNTGGPAIISQKNRQLFANQLDLFMTRYCQC